MYRGVDWVFHFIDGTFFHLYLLKIMGITEINYRGTNPLLLFQWVEISTRKTLYRALLF